MSKLNLICYYTSWDNSCNSYFKVIEKVLQEFPEVVFNKIDIESSNDEYSKRITFTPYTIIKSDDQDIKFERGGNIDYLTLYSELKKLNK